MRRVLFEGGLGLGELLGLKDMIVEVLQKIASKSVSILSHVGRRSIHIWTNITNIFCEIDMIRYGQQWRCWRGICPWDSRGPTWMDSGKVTTWSVWSMSFWESKIRPRTSYGGSSLTVAGGWIHVGSRLLQQFLCIYFHSFLRPWCHIGFLCVRRTCIYDSPEVDGWSESVFSSDWYFLWSAVSFLQVKRAQPVGEHAPLTKTFAADVEHVTP